MTLVALGRDHYAGVKYMVKTQGCPRQLTLKSGDQLKETTIKAVLTVLGKKRHLQLFTHLTQFVISMMESLRPPNHRLSTHKSKNFMREPSSESGSSCVGLRSHGNSTFTVVVNCGIKINNNEIWQVLEKLFFFSIFTDRKAFFQHNINDFVWYVCLRTGLA